jgi:hypothetical protein
LCTGRRGISIAMLSGGVFAILLYVIFAAGLGAILGMRGGIFPEVGQGSPAALAQASAAPAESAPPESPSSDSASADSAPALPALPKPPESEESGPTAPDGAAEANGVQAAAPGNDMAAASNVPPSTAPAPAPSPRPAGGKEAQAQGKTPGQCGPDKTICVPAFVSDIGRHLGFREYPDFFKMLLLAFLAGFAERLVPDALDRLTRRTGGAPTDRDHDRAAAVAVQAGSE